MTLAVFSCIAIVASAAVGFSAAVADAPAQGASSLAIAVAPFERAVPSGAAVPDIEKLLADRIGTQGVQRIVGPRELAVEGPGAEAAVGEAIGLVLPDGVVKDFFLRSVEASIGPATVDLVAFSFTLGFSLNVNLMAVLGVVLATYLFRWY